MALAVTGLFISSCGQDAAPKITNIRIDISADASGRVVAKPWGRHVDWPADHVVQLVNHDSLPHEVTFTELKLRFHVDAAGKDGPTVIFYPVDIRGEGQYNWRCTLNCPDPAPEGYVHIAEVP